MTTTEDGNERDAGPRVSWIALLVPFFVVSLLASRPIRDNSFLWHIRAGDVQDALGSVLDVDVFSFTATGEGWRTQSWIAELFYARLEATFSGLAWANWMLFGVVALTMVFVGLSLYMSTRSVIATGILMMVAVWLMGVFTVPRPVIFSFLLLAMLVVVLQHRERVAWAVVPIIWVWAGVHGSWVIGGALILLEWIRLPDRKLFLAGVAGLASTIATAHGFGTWQIVLEFLSARENLSYMNEWKPPDFADVFQGPYVLVILGVIIAAVRGKISMRDLIVIFPFVVFGLTTRRAVFPATIVLLPWAALAIPETRSSLPVMSKVTFSIVSAAVIALVLAPMFVNPLGLLGNERFPTQEAVEALGDRRAFHGDAVGGYLIYANWPDRFVYIDDRAELYSPSQFAEFRRVRDGQYREAFEAHQIDAAVSRPDWPLTAALTEDGWLITHEDEYFVTFVRP